MPKQLEKPEPFGRGYVEGEDENKLKKVKPEQLDKCDRRVPEVNHNFRPNTVVQPAANCTDTGLRDIFSTVKSLDANRYATKKTIAQGMLDIALLTANASQLKYILQVGKQHEFYTLMLTLICLSIGLQAVVGLLFIVVGGLDINRRRDQWLANIINDAILIGVFVISLTNVVISGFGMEFSNKPREILQGMIFIFLGSSLNINKQEDQKKANMWNNVALASMVLTVAINVIISVFEMREDHA